ncbi:Phospholipid scramblase 2 [Trichoplax sp. H2]|nr:Phospholipid scramblase 2 [Trichoplax sp. H2]|eukprot:RDD36571.1 Phospholipid scramblase 2 [Trichoplax sp. H2]
MVVPIAQPSSSEKEMQEVTPCSPTMDTVKEQSPQTVPMPMPMPMPMPTQGVDVGQSPLPPPILQQPGGAMPVPPPISQQPIAGPGGPDPATQSYFPQSLQWMQVPAPNTVSNDCSPGLERLFQLSQVIICPDIQQQELFMPMFRSKYQVKNNAGQLIYYAIEDNVTTAINMYGYDLAEIALYDSMERKVMQLSRAPSGEVSGCLSAILYKLNVACPPENMIGSVVQTSIFGPKHAVTSPNGVTELAINGPGHCCAIRAAEGYLNFPIISKSGKVIGNVAKHLPNMGNLQCNMEVNFPTDLHPNFKALLVGFAIIMDHLMIARHRYNLIHPAYYGTAAHSSSVFSGSSSHVHHRHRMHHHGMHHHGMHHHHHGIHHHHHGIHHHHAGAHHSHHFRHR